jgi:hypothetical protein
MDPREAGIKEDGRSSTRAEVLPVLITHTSAYLAVCWHVMSINKSMLNERMGRGRCAERPSEKVGGKGKAE